MTREDKLEIISNVLYSIGGKSGKPIFNTDFCTEVAETIMDDIEPLAYCDFCEKKAVGSVTLSFCEEHSMQ